VKDFGPATPFFSEEFGVGEDKEVGVVGDSLIKSFFFDWFKILQYILFLDLN
jgi:hypothetical protein